jgi:hypothetical protein
MKSPRFKYLTPTYIDFLGLEEQPIQLPRNEGYICQDLSFILPPPGRETFFSGVFFEGHLYLPTYSGKDYSYDLHR